MNPPFASINHRVDGDQPPTSTLTYIILETKSEVMRSDVLQVDFEQDPIYKQHLRDAKNADDFPEGGFHSVVLEPGELTVEATPEAMRWFYDYLQHLIRAWRLEGEQWDARAASEMASKVWHEHGDDLPDQQRPRKIIG